METVKITHGIHIFEVPRATIMAHSDDSFLKTSLEIGNELVIPNQFNVQQVAVLIAFLKLKSPKAPAYDKIQSTIDSTFTPELAEIFNTYYQDSKINDITPAIELINFADFLGIPEFTHCCTATLAVFISRKSPEKLRTIINAVADS